MQEILLPCIGIPLYKIFTGNVAVLLQLLTQEGLTVNDTDGG